MNPVDDGPSDSELVALARDGERAAFGVLVRRHQAAAQRLATVIGGSSADAPDIVQEAFVKAFRRLATLRHDDSVRGWMLRIVANEARNAARSRVRRLRRDDLTADWWAGDPSDPQAAALSADDAARLVEALRRLPGPDRDVIGLRYFAGLNEAECAAALQIPAGTVKSRLSRALGRLREFLEGGA